MIEQADAVLQPYASRTGLELDDVVGDAAAGSHYTDDEIRGMAGVGEGL